VPADGVHSGDYVDSVVDALVIETEALPVAVVI